jgi:hypothetical protein
MKLQSVNFGNAVIKTAGMAIASIAIGFTASAPAGAVSIVPDSGWQNFTFADVGSIGNPTFQFTLAQAGELKVTDAFQSGDRFEVYNFATLLGLTSVPGSSGDQIGSDADAAFIDPRWSSGIFSLAAGTYDISVETIVSPFGGGGAYLRVDTVAQSVPEPFTVIGTLIGGTAALRMKKKLKSSHKA